MRSSLVTFALSFGLLVPAVAHASSISPIFNTGVAANGTVLTQGALDPHYIAATYTNGAFVSNGQATVVSANPAWVTPSGASWISIGPAGSTTGYASPVYYAFETTFTLASVPSNYALTGLWSADNSAWIYLNGANTGNAIGDTGYNMLSNFSINSGFQAGVNTVDFVVFNSGSGNNPIGLVVEAAPTPEPSSLVLLGTGILGVAGAARRRFLKS